MEYSCVICGETFHDEILLNCHIILYHEDGSSTDSEEDEETVQPRPSVIQYAPARNENRLTIQLQAEAFPNSSVRQYVIVNNQLNLDTFLQQSVDLINTTLERELQRLHVVKFGLQLDTTFTNVENELSVRGFICRTRSLIVTSDRISIINECVQELILKILEHEARGSGWSLLRTNSLLLKVHKHGYGYRGSSYIELPKKIKDTKSCINVKNTEDNLCFKYSMLVKFLINDHRRNMPGRRYRNVEHRYNFNGLMFPMAVDKIQMFERRNPNVSVNVFGLDDYNNVFPLKIVDRECTDHTDLLLLKKSENEFHYVNISSFNRLVSKQVSKNEKGKTVCKRCFCFVHKSYNAGGRQWLLAHHRLCGNHKPARVILPCTNNSIVKFKNIKHQYRIPIVVYADFEASLLPIDVNEEDIMSITKYQEHQPNSYSLILKSVLSEDHLQAFGLSSKPKVYRGDDAASRLMDDLYDIAEKVQGLYSHIVPMNNLSREEIQKHSDATHCYLCEEVFTIDNHKSHDHSHLTGEYNGAACNSCNLNYKLPNFIPIIFHNLSKYDAHFIIPQLGRDDGKIDVLAQTNENFISFSKTHGKIRLRFLDSYRFLPSSLMGLSKNMEKHDLIETCQLVPQDKLDLVLRKGVFPYDYITSPLKFEETVLPPKESFYSKLQGTDISEDDYNHACKVWQELEMTILGEYSDFYVKLDITLLCDIMEKFRDTSFVSYGLDPLHSYTSPGLSYQAMLKKTKCKLQLLMDIDMINFIECNVRGGLTQCVTRHVVANNKYLRDFDATKPSNYLTYLDANQLYPYAMSQPMPYGDFQWVNPDDIGDVSQIPADGDIGYILECDMEYPEVVHDLHHDFPLLGKSETPPNSKHPKLLLTVDHKDKYIAHYRVIQQAIQLGLKLTKVHRVLQFSQSCWLKPYVELNTAKRSSATNKFEIDFYKLMNNSVFGKTLQNPRNHKNVRLCTNERQCGKLVQKSNFNTSQIIKDNLVIVSMHKVSIRMDKPIYVGFSILDISKIHMYDFHYNKMVPFYGRDNITICYMDTDAFLYNQKTDDLYEDLKTFPYACDMDFSSYPVTHPNYSLVNKKVLGKFKDEVNGKPITELVCLRPKMYAIKMLEPDGEVIEKKRSKGVKYAHMEKDVRFEHFRRCLFDQETLMSSYNTIRSFNHNLYSITQRKKALSYFDDKRYILDDKIHTLPFGHYSIRDIEQ